MPTQTYHNLPPEKRERIFGAAVEEFSNHSFSQASINRVVKAAGIPRGSFYQYFTDKEDLYLLVMERIGEEKLTMFSHLRGRETEGEKPFIVSQCEAMPAIFEWAARCPEYNRIALLMIEDGSEFIHSMVERMDAQKDQLRALLEQDSERGFLREGIDLDTVIELYMMIAVELLRTCYGGEDGTRRCIEKARKMLDIIARGTLSKEGKREWESYKNKLF